MKNFIFLTTIILAGFRAQATNCTVEIKGPTEQGRSEDGTWRGQFGTNSGEVIVGRYRLHVMTSTHGESQYLMVHKTSSDRLIFKEINNISYHTNPDPFVWPKLWNAEINADLDQIAIQCTWKD